jgi:hypothetical protein
VKRRGEERRGVGLIALLFAILYAVLAFSSIGLKAPLEPLAPVEIHNDTVKLRQSYRANTRVFPFYTASKAGYFTEEGSIDLLLNRMEKLVVSKNILVSEDPNGDNLILSDITSGKNHTINLSGYPFLIGGQLFILRQDQQAIARLDDAGKVLWTMEFGSIVTTADSTESHSAWGTLRGTIRIISKDGLSTAEIRPDSFGIDTHHSCIYSVALSRDGLSVAVLYGLEPQYLAIFSHISGTWVLDHVERLAGSVRRSVASAFSEDGRFLLMQTSQGLVSYNLHEKEKEVFVLDNPENTDLEVMIRPVGKSSLVFLTSGTERKNLGLIAENSLKAFFPAGEDSVSLDVQDGFIHVSGDSAIRRFLFNEGSGNED